MIIKSRDLVSGFSHSRDLVLKNRDLVRGRGLVSGYSHSRDLVSRINQRIVTSRGLVRKIGI